MNPEIRINTMSISKLGHNYDSFNKYDIEAALEEIENTENETKVKYEFTLLSNPKNTRINVDGIATMHGSESEISEFLEQDKNHIPRILYLIYQDLFPLLYTNSLAMQIPCPSYKLAQISSPAHTETIGTQEFMMGLTNSSENDLSSQSNAESDNVKSTEEQQKPEIEIPTS